MLPEPEFATNLFLGNIGASLRVDDGDSGEGEEEESDSGYGQDGSGKGKQVMIPERNELEEQMAEMDGRTELGKRDDDVNGNSSGDDTSQWRAATAV